MAYMRLVISTAARFRNYGLPMSDLVQEGATGLMQAAARFEPSGGPFSTYAAWWIRSAMQDYILRNWSVVRTGTTAAQKALFFNLRRLRAKIGDGSGGPLDEAGRAFIAPSCRSTPTRSRRWRCASPAATSRSTPRSARPARTSGRIFADERPTPEETVMFARDSRTRSIWLAQALAELTDREQIIIKERRLRDDARTLEELGRDLGISKERVRQIEHRALEKLKVSLLERSVERDDAVPRI